MSPLGRHSGDLSGLDLPVVVVVGLSGLELHLKRGQHALAGQGEKKNTHNGATPIVPDAPVLAPSEAGSDAERAVVSRASVWQKLGETYV